VGSIYNFISDQFTNVVKSSKVNAETLEMEPMHLVGNPNLLKAAKSNGADELVLVDEGGEITAEECGLAAVYNFEPMELIGKPKKVTEYTFEEASVIKIETETSAIQGANRFAPIAAWVNGASSMK